MAEYNWCRITGRSMEPEFSMGDEVLVVSVPVEDIRPGDIVTFRWCGMLITHRIVRRVCREGEISFEEKADVDVRTNSLPTQNIVGRGMSGRIKKVSLCKERILIK